MIEQIDADIAYLTATLCSPVEKRVLLRPSLESALFRMGHDEDEIDAALDRYYNTLRTVH